MEFAVTLISKTKRVCTLEMLLKVKEDEIAREKKRHSIDVEAIRAQSEGQRKEYFRLLEENSMLHDELTHKDFASKKND